MIFKRNHTSNTGSLIALRAAALGIQLIATLDIVITLYLFVAMPSQFSIFGTTSRIGLILDEVVQFGLILYWISIGCLVLMMLYRILHPSKEIELARSGIVAVSLIAAYCFWVTLAFILTLAQGI